MSVSVLMTGAVERRQLLGKVLSYQNVFRRGLRPEGGERQHSWGHTTEGHLQNHTCFYWSGELSVRGKWFGIRLGRWAGDEVRI